MKQLYFLILAGLFAVESQSQIVDIPDPAFKAELIEMGVDINNDGEIQLSEAEAVTYLGLSLCTLDNTIGIQSFVNLEQLSFSSYCDIASPVDLSGMASVKSLHFHKCSIPSVNLSGMTGLEQISHGYVNVDLVNPEGAVNLKKFSYYMSGDIPMLDLSPFENLEELSSQGTSVDAVNLTGLSHLEYFKITGAGEMTGIDLSDLIALKKFELTGANLTGIDFSNNLLLEEISTRGNSLGSLDVSMLPNLKTLHCQSNDLTLLDISNNTNLESLHCGNNQLTSLDLSNLHKLSEVTVSGNLFETLDFSGLTDATGDMLLYDVSDNPNLVSVILKNGKTDVLSAYDNCPNLVYLCVDDWELPYYTDLFDDLGITTIQVNTYCSFVPGGNHNTVNGTVSFDGNNDGCDAADGVTPGLKFTITDGTGSGVTYSNDAGFYEFHMPQGDFTITPGIENPYFTISPASATVNFADANNNTQTQNFCLTPVGVHRDLEITLIPLDNARPGFDAHYQISYKNKGNQPLSGSVDLAFNDAVLDLVTANPVTDSQSLNQLQWNYSNLLPFESRTIHFTLNLNSPMETPAVNNGDILGFTVAISPLADDETAYDNTSAIEQTVVGSYDPNDKTCLEGDTITWELLGDFLHYVIRFQNTGTASAENVVIEDLIDETKFDMASLELIGSSHPYLTRIEGNRVEFIFDGIALPAEQDNEPASHGFVAFKIRTKPTLQPNTVIENKAGIFFDFNFPITTNTAITNVSALGIGEVEDQSVAMAPNPVRNTLSISADHDITSVQIFDIQGRLLQTSLQNNTAATLDFSQMTRGAYFVKVSTAKGIKVQKIIKE